MSTGFEQVRPQEQAFVQPPTSLSLFESLEQRLLLSTSDGLETAILWMNGQPVEIQRAANQAELLAKYEAQARAGGAPNQPNANAVYLYGLTRGGYDAAFGNPWVVDMDWWYGCSPTTGGIQTSYWASQVAGSLYPGNNAKQWQWGEYPAFDSYIFDVPDFPNGVVSGYSHIYDGRYGGNYYSGYAYDENDVFHAPDSIADFMLTAGDGSIAENIRWGYDNFNAWDDPRTPDVNESWNSYSYYLSEIEWLIPDPDYFWGWANIRRFDDGTIGLNPNYVDRTPQAWYDYQTEILAGRPVHMLLESPTANHSALGIGYWVDTALNNVFPMDPNIPEPNSWRLYYVLYTAWNSGIEMWEWRRPVDFVGLTPQVDDPETVRGLAWNDYIWHYILPGQNGYRERHSGYGFWVADTIGTNFQTTRWGTPGIGDDSTGDLTGYLSVMLSEYDANRAQDWQIRIGLGDPATSVDFVDVPITHWGRPGTDVSEANYPSGVFGRTTGANNNLDETTKANFHFVKTDIDLNALKPSLRQFSANGGTEKWFLQVVDTNSGVAGDTQVARILDFQVRYKQHQEDSWFTAQRDTAVMNSAQGGVVYLQSQVYGDLKGVVYHDWNGNHIQDAGEPGIAGVRVFIDNDLDGTHNGLSETARDATDQNNVLDWVDRNADGDWDPGEGERWVITAADGSYHFDRSTYDLAGTGISDLTPTTYQVRVDATTLPIGMVQSQPGRQDENHLAANYESTLKGGNHTDIDFGYYHLGTISGRISQLDNTSLSGWRVFLDEDGDNVWDGSATNYIDRNSNGQFDWYDTNDNGLFDNSELSPELELSVLTQADGTYQFTNLPPRAGSSHYTVVELLKDGWIESTPGIRAWTESPLLAGTFYEIELDDSALPGATMNAVDVNFVNDKGMLADLTGGLVNAAAPGLVLPNNPFQATWEILNVGLVATSGQFNVRFYASRDAQLATTDDNYYLGETTVTDIIAAGGSASTTLTLANFPNLLPAEYYIRVIIDPVTAAQTDPTMLIGQVLESDETNNGTDDAINVRITVPGIRGSRWADLYNPANPALYTDGVRDPGEPGVPGILFYIDSNGNGVIDPGERTSITDANGEFGFAGLPTGTHLIREAPSNNWTRTYPTTDRYGVPYQANTLVSGIAFGSRAKTDLYADQVIYSTFDPHSVYPPGQSWNIWWDIYNSGPLTVGPFFVDFYASTDNIITPLDPANPNAPHDYYLGRVNVTSIPTNYYVDVNLSLLNFPSLAPGNYFVGVDIDPTNQVWESNEDNNLSADPTDKLVVFGRPELSTDPVGLHGFTPGVITNPGDPRFEIVWTVRNSGWGNTNDEAIEDGSGFFVQFYASDNADITIFDHFLGKVWIDAMPGMSWREIRLPMFNFPDIPAGDYYIGAIIDRPDWIDEPLETNNVSTSNVYPLRVPGIRGEVVHDIDNDGVKDWSEPARPGMVVWLDLNGDGIPNFVDLNGDGIWNFVDADLNGVYDEGEQIEPEEPYDITDRYGQYSFTGLDAATYDIRMVKPWQGAELQYAPDPADVVFTASPEGTVITGVQFFKTLYSRADGYVWYDYDGDGVRDGGEGLMDDWRVYIDTNNNDKLDWTDNPANPNVGAWDEGEGERWFLSGSFIGGWDQGLYQFKRLLALSPLVNQLNPEINDDPTNTKYNIRIVPQAFWVMTYPDDAENTVEAVSAHLYTRNDFGEAHAGRITGLKWHDLNANAARGQNEPGLAGWTIYLDQNNDGVFNVWETSTVTDLNGQYIFENLKPGYYTVREVIPDGWQQSVPGAGGRAPIFVGSSQTVGGVNFANYQYATITGAVWHDIDADRVHRPEEQGLEGWVVYLDLNTNGVRDWTDTNNNGIWDGGEGEQWTKSIADGSFRFDGLMPGREYIVRELVNTGWAQSAPTFFYHQIYLASGDNYTGAEFGNYKPGSIAGTAWNDLNGNGVKDANEPGLEGWVIFLDQNSNNRLDAGESFIQTGSDGNYYFGNLIPSAYRIVQVLRSADWVQTYPASIVHDVTVTSGDNVTGYHFGNYKYGVISGTVWRDADADGVYDWLDANNNGRYDAGEGESPLAGWTVFVDTDKDGILDAGERSVVSDAYGQYTIDRLSPGTYYIAESQQANWIQSAPTAMPETGIRQHRVTITSESVVRSVNFGNYQSGSIPGTVWNDVNGNGVREPDEPGLPSATIFLDLNNNRILDWVDDPAKTNVGAWDEGEGEQWTVTNSMGAYTLANLTPGVYTVAEITPVGWIQSYPAYITGLPDHAGVVIDSGTVAAPRDFGNYQYGRIRGLKWDDANANGVRDAGEAALAGWGILAFRDIDLDGILDESEMTETYQAATGADGTYEISGLKIGQYIVREVNQADWDQIYPGGAGQSIVNILSGSIISNIDFGNIQISRISGIIWHDLDSDGLREWIDVNGDGVWTPATDTGEPAMWNWMVLLDADNDGVRDWTDTNGNFIWDSGEGEQWVYSGEDGSYLLDHLRPGTHVVRVLPLAGWIKSFPTLDAYVVPLASGQYINDRDFAFFQYAAISGMKWSDLDADGTKDAGEAGLVGWRIFLDSDDDGSLDWTDANANNAWDAGEGEAWTLTAADGTYTFGPSFQLRPGTYTVREVNQAAWTQTSPANNRYQVGVISGQNSQDNNFGNTQWASITGLVWREAVTDGIYDPGNVYEIPLSGWQIFLDADGDGVLDWTDGNANNAWDAGEGEQWSLSGADGKYTFAGLLPSRVYTVATVLKSGFVRYFPLLTGIHVVTIPSNVNGNPAQVVQDIDFGMKQLPRADDTTLTTAENQPATGTMQAQSADASPLTWILDSYPIHGTLAFNAATGAYTYTPAANYNGPDYFTFHVVSGLDRSNNGRVDITVTPVNSVPLSQNQLVRVSNGNSVVINLFGSDIETPYDNLKFTIVTPPTSGPAPVRLANGQYRYTPNPNFCGVDRFVYEVTDTGDPAGTNQDVKTSVRATVTINVERTVPIVANRWTTYTDASGDTVYLLLWGAGSGTAMFASTGWADLDYLYLTGTTANSMLLISAYGNTTVRDIAVDGSLLAIVGQLADLTGNIVVSGGLQQLLMRDVANPTVAPAQHTISVGAANPYNLPLYVNLQKVTDLTLTSKAPLSYLLVQDWTDTLGAKDSVQAPYASVIMSTGNAWRRLAGNFDADLTLNGQGLPAYLPALSTAQIIGSLRNASWNITGNLNLLYTLGTVLNSTVRTTGSMNVLYFGASNGSSFRAGMSANPGVPTAADFVNTSAAIRYVVVLGLAGASPTTQLVTNTTFMASSFGVMSLTNTDLATSKVYVRKTTPTQEFTYVIDYNRATYTYLIYNPYLPTNPFPVGFLNEI